MHLLHRFVLPATAAAALALIIAIASPRAVHALVAVLVQVGNTIQSPAITQDTSKTASQIVNLVCVPGLSPPGCQPGSLWFYLYPTYAVPTGQKLVITSILIVPAGGSGNESVTLTDVLDPLYYHLQVTVPNSVTSQFTFPSGMVLSAGSQPQISAVNSTTVYIYGYLTAE